MAHARPALAKAYNQAVTEATDQGATSSGEAGPSAAPPPLSQALLHSRPSELDLLESSGGRPESPIANGKEVVSPIKRRNSKRLSLGESRTDEDIAAEVAALEAALLQKDFATLEEAFYKGMRKQAGALLLSNIFEHLGLGVSQEAITEIERRADADRNGTIGKQELYDWLDGCAARQRGSKKRLPMAPPARALERLGLLPSRGADLSTLKQMQQRSFQALSMFDADGDGEVDVDDLRSTWRLLLDENLSRAEAKEMLLMAEEAVGDKKLEGRLTLSQLRRFLSGRGPPPPRDAAPRGAAPRHERT